MVIFRRFVCLLLLAVSPFLGSSAFAAAFYTYSPLAKVISEGYSMDKIDGWQDICPTSLTGVPFNYALSKCKSGFSSFTERYNRTDGYYSRIGIYSSFSDGSPRYVFFPNGVTYSAKVALKAICNPGDHLNLDTKFCESTDPFDPPNPCSDLKGNKFSASVPLSDYGPPNYTIPDSTCSGGCLAVDAGGIGLIGASQTSYFGDFVYTGAACSASSGSGEGDAPAPDPDYENSCEGSNLQIGGYCYPTDGACPSGTIVGDFNGKQVCVPIGDSAGPDPVAPDPEPAPGGTGGDGTGTPGQNTGSCPAGSPDCGAASGSDSGFCDPATDTGCKGDGGKFGGGANSGSCPAGSPDCGDASGSDKGKCDVKTDSSCTPNSISSGVCSEKVRVEPVCKSSDAVSCSIALNTWNLRCDSLLDAKKDGPPDELVSKGEALVAGGVPDSWANPEPTDDFSDITSRLDSTGSGFGGSTASCPSDYKINLPIGSFTFPVHFICDWAGKVRPVVIFLGWLSSFFILFRFMRSA